MTIGINLDSQNLTGGVVDGDGKILARESLLTESERGQEAIFFNLNRLINILSERFEIEAVGVSIPGYLEQDSGRIAIIPTMPELKKVNLAKNLKLETHLPVIVENKAIAALLSERWLGSAKEYLNAVLLTLDREVWGAVLLEGRVYRGFTGRAGDFGRQIIDLSAEKLSGHGTFESLTAGKGIQKLTKMTALDLLQRAQANDLAARKMLEELSEKICTGIYNLWCVLDPEAVILAGQITEYFSEFRRYFLDLPVKVIPAELGEDVFVLGAAKAAMGGAKIQPSAVKDLAESETF